MKIAFFGTSEFAVPSLRGLAEHIDLVVTQPARPSGRGLKLSASPVEVVARELGLPVESPEKCRAPEFVESIRGGQFDVLLVAAYGQILSQALLDSAPYGAINLHGSILPRHRGAAPIARAILAGDTITGVTVMQMDRGLDTGDMIAIEETTIGPDETAGELTGRLAILAARMAEEWLPRIIRGEIEHTPQNEALATYAAKITKADAKLSLSQSATETYRRFRAVTPTPGAYFEIADDGALKVHSMQPIDQSGPSGILLTTSPQPVIAVAQGALELTMVQPHGKRPMSGRDWVNGRRLRPGDPVGIIGEP
ncbi:MAG: methionyl-tRNA formyltransferase [Fimbriimonadaceae bacterium]